MAADVLPTTKFFCRLNLRNSDFPEMRKEQERLIEDAEVDYIVFRVERDVKAEEISDGNVWDNYTCVAQANQEYIKPGYVGADAEVDYIVFRVERDVKAEEISDGNVWDNYTCVAQANQEYIKPGYVGAFQYYLFKKNGI